MSHEIDFNIYEDKVCSLNYMGIHKSWHALIQALPKYYQSQQASQPAANEQVRPTSSNNNVVGASSDSIRGAPATLTEIY
jgi:hypothetical protein